MRDAVKAAKRIQEALEKAESGNYLMNGWYSYIDRTDVEVVVRSCLAGKKK